MLRPGMVLDSLRLVDSAFLVEADVGRGSKPNEILLSPTEIRLEIPDTFVRPRKKEKKTWYIVHGWSGHREDCYFERRFMIDVPIYCWRASLSNKRYGRVKVAITGYHNVQSEFFLMRFMLASRHLHPCGSLSPKPTALCTTNRLQNAERQSACNQGLYMRPLSVQDLGPGLYVKQLYPPHPRPFPCEDWTM